MGNFLTLMGAVIFGLLNVGCSNSSESSPTTSASALEGTWKGNCSSTVEGMFGPQTRISFSFTGSNCVSSTEDFTAGTENCAASNLLSTTKGSCTFKLDTGKIDFYRSKIEITSNIADLSSTALKSSCPTIKFIKGQAVDTKGCSYYPVPLEIFNIYEIKDSTTLYFGTTTSTLDSSTAAKRPAVIKTSESYQKI